MRDRIVGLKSIPLTKLRGFAMGNPKTPTKGELAQLEGSLSNHGYVLPVAVRDVGDGTYEIIDGHSRVNVIAATEPTAKLKCLVLDVHSVADGRRILLALQHHVGFDTDKLEGFIRSAIDDGANASDLMADTGMTGADLDAFASSVSDAIQNAGTGDGGGDPDDPERVSRAGLNPEHVQFAVPLTRSQSKVVRDAIALAKRLSDRKVSGDALEIVCAEYLGAHKTAPENPITARPKASKRGGK